MKAAETKESYRNLDDQIAALLKNEVKAHNQEFVETKASIETTQKERSVQEIIDDANNKFLLEVLSPEIKANEEKKRKHKDWLMIIMGAFLLFQFALVAVMIVYIGFWIVRLHIQKNPFSDSTIQMIATFIGAYITSIIVELIAILRYIVRNVFDTSIAGMVKDNIKKKKKENGSL